LCHWYLALFLSENVPNVKSEGEEGERLNMNVGCGLISDVRTEKANVNPRTLVCILRTCGRKVVHGRI
jgi:hypothetical protein